MAGLREEIVASPQQVLEMMEFGECTLFSSHYFYSTLFFAKHSSGGFHSLCTCICMVILNTDRCFHFSLGIIFQLIDILRRRT